MNSYHLYISLTYFYLSLSTVMICHVQHIKNIPFPDTFLKQINYFVWCWSVPLLKKKEDQIHWVQIR